MIQPWPQRRFEIQHHNQSGMFVRQLRAEEPRGTLLFIHGLGESGLCFERLVAADALRNWNHWIPDLPGYGKSPWLEQPLRLPEMAQRIEALLDDLDAEPVILVGHSMGGVLGTLLCENAPHRVRAFINIEGNISPADCGYSSQAAHYSLAEWLNEGWQKVVDGLYNNQTERPAVIRPYCASIQMADPRAFHCNSEDLVEFSAMEKLAARMAAFQIPKVYLFGSPRGTGERSRALLREAEIATIGIDNSGHWPFFDHPTAFLRQFVDFLDGLPG